MSERKVLNKYYPPDFDPSKIPRLRLPKDRQYTVRLMAPCNMKCKTCGEYIYKGKKFNARKETVQNEEYLGIKIFRFYIKCPRCLAEITFKTDPENADYIVEHGATRNFQALKLAEEAARKEAMDIEEEEKNNPMKLLENRTKQSKQEMDSIEALEELKDLNQRHAKVDFEKLLKRNQLQLVEELKRQEDEDEDFIRSVFLTPDGEKIKRAFDDSDSNGKISSPVVQSSRPTDILCEDPEPSKNPSKKPKLWEKNSVSSSHEKCMAGLKNSLKVKKGSASSSSKSDLDESKSSVSANATTSEVNATSSEVNAQISEKPSALSLLCSYDNSDSDN